MDNPNAEIAPVVVPEGQMPDNKQLADNRKNVTLLRLNFIAKWFSTVTLVFLVIFAFWLKPYCPHWLGTWVLPILTAAAVGYLTNMAAIWLLFQPYEKTRFLPFQGVIPSNKRQIGEKLGEMIPKYLLRPEQLSAQLGDLARGYLRNPQMLADVREKINVFMKRYSGKVAEYIAPHIIDAVKTAVKDNLTYENLRSLSENVVTKYLGNDETRGKICDAIVDELQANSGKITQIIAKSIEDEGALASISMFLFNGREKIRRKIDEAFANRRTQELISGGLLKMTMKLKDWLNSPEGEEKMRLFLEENKEKINGLVEKYIADNLPKMISEWLGRDELWQTVENQLLPLLQSFIEHQLRKDGESIIQSFDIPGKIRNSVEEMDMRRLHEAINEVSDENLTAIQLLGYLLGGIAGVLLGFVS